MLPECIVAGDLCSVYSTESKARGQHGKACGAWHASTWHVPVAAWLTSSCKQLSQMCPGLASDDVQGTPHLVMNDASHCRRGSATAGHQRAAYAYYAYYPVIPQPLPAVHTVQHSLTTAME